MALNLDTKTQKYTIRGRFVSEDEAINEITLIRELNRSNNETLEGIRLGKDVQRFRFPDKFSLDLADIHQSCFIQKKLIEEIRTLSKEVNTQNIKISMLSNNQDPSKVNKQIWEKERNNIELEIKLKREKEEIERHKKELNSKFNLLRIQEQRVEKFLKELERQKRSFKDYNNYLECSYNEIKKINSKKHFEVFSEIKSVKLVNGEASKQSQILTNDLIKKFADEQFSKERRQVISENEKLKGWIKRYKQSIQRILSLRLIKLRELGNQKQIERLKYIPRIHEKTMTLFLQAQEFPERELLDDFEAVMRQSLDLKQKNARLYLENQTLKINKQLVEELIGELTNFRSAVIEEFLLCGQKRKEIAEQYIKLFEFKESPLELIDRMTIDKLRQFQLNPNRILRQIQKETDEFKRYKANFQKEYSMSASSQELNSHSNFQKIKKYLSLLKEDNTNKQKSQSKPNPSRQQIDPSKRVMQIWLQEDNKQQEFLKEDISPFKMEKDNSRNLQNYDTPAQTYKNRRQQYYQRQKQKINEKLTKEKRMQEERDLRVEEKFRFLQELQHQIQRQKQEEENLRSQLGRLQDPLEFRRMYINELFMGSQTQAYPPKEHSIFNNHYPNDVQSRDVNGAKNRLEYNIHSSKWEQEDIQI